MTSNILLMTFPLHQSLLKVLMYYFHFTKFIIRIIGYLTLNVKSFRKLTQSKLHSILLGTKFDIIKFLRISFILWDMYVHTKRDKDFRLSMWNWRNKWLDFIPFQLHQHFAICGQWAYCWNHKTGSTTILDMLVRQCGYHDILEIHKIDLQR